MAAPIAHLYLALQILAGPLKSNNFDHKEFILGTSFPDIRYLKVIKREETHTKDISFSYIKNLNRENSFHAGLLFHSLVDKVREEYLNKIDIYKDMPKVPYPKYLLKFAEDQILTRNLNFKPEEYNSYFNKISPYEKLFDIKTEKIELWHNILKEYFASGLNSTTVSNMLKAVYPKSKIKRGFLWLAYSIGGGQYQIDSISNSEIIINIIKKFYLNFSKNLN